MILRYSFVIFFIFISSVLAVQKSGLLHPEALERIPNYLDSRNVFQKVFDIDKNEYGLYQARELSHFFDYVDANAIKLSATLGLVHFYSLVYLASIFALILGGLYLARNYFGHQTYLIPSLVILIFLFSPVPFLSPYMFRSAKILVSVATVTFCIATVRFLTQKSTSTSAKIIVVASALFLAAGDRQGLYILLIAIVLVSLTYILFGHKKYLKLSILLALGTVISLIYSYALAPILIKIDIGHFPSFSYHKIDLRLAKPVFFRYSTIYSLDVFKYFLGNLNRFIVLFFLLNFLAIYVIQQTEKIGGRLRYSLILIAAVMSILILNTLMILKHSAIPLEEVRRVYYALPLATIILICALFFTGKITEAYPKINRFLLATLLLILMLNISSIDAHFMILKNGLLKESYEDSPKVVDCIKSTGEHSVTLKVDKRALCELLKR